MTRKLPIDAETVGFNWHLGDGGELSRRSPYEVLICTIYTHAVYEMRRYKAGTQLFNDAANFLLRDPYGILSESAYNKLSGEIWEKRDAYRAELERDLIKEGGKMKNEG